MRQVPLAELTPNERHSWLTPLVVPRPIALVSTLSASGVGNLAPFSFFALGGMNPPSVAFCPIADRHGAPKDTLRNLQETGECTINIVSRAMAEQVNQSSAPYAPEVDEFDMVHFTRVASTLVRPPRVAESAAQLECRVFQFVPHGTGPAHATWVIAEIVALHVDEAILAPDGRPDTALLNPVARLGRNEWAEIAAANIFTLDRPTAV